MEINIGDADKKGNRPVKVMDGEAVLYEGSAADVAAAHKLIAVGRKHGFDSDEFAKAAK